MCFFLARQAIEAEWQTFLVSLLLDSDMLAKLTSKNQLTLPKAAMSRVEPAEYVEVTAREGTPYSSANRSPTSGLASARSLSALAPPNSIFRTK